MKKKKAETPPVPAISASDFKVMKRSLAGILGEAVGAALVGDGDVRQSMAESMFKQTALGMLVATVRAYLKEPTENNRAGMKLALERYDSVEKDAKDFVSFGSPE